MRYLKLFGRQQIFKQEGWREGDFLTVFWQVEAAARVPLEVAGEGGLDVALAGVAAVLLRGPRAGLARAVAGPRRLLPPRQLGVQHAPGPRPPRTELVVNTLGEVKRYFTTVLPQLHPELIHCKALTVGARSSLLLIRSIWHRNNAKISILFRKNI